MDKQRFIALLGLLGSFFALGVIALGAFTRLIDAGLGCPDWPGCYGNLTVPMGDLAQQIINLHYPETPLVIYKAWAEMLHRYFVGALSIFILGIIFIIFSQKRLRIRSNIILAFSLILLLLYQILLGRWTVTLKLLPVIVTQHLLGGFFILAMLWLIYLNNKLKVVYAIKPVPRQKMPQYVFPAAIGGLIILLLQISLGAWTSTNYASLSCPDFPFCVNDQVLILQIKEAFNFTSPVGINYQGGVLSDAARQTIQMTHRLGALLFTVYIFFFAILSLGKLKYWPELQRALYLILALLCIQLCLGISNIIFKLPLITTIAHNLTAALLLISLITFTFKVAFFDRH